MIVALVLAVPAIVLLVANEMHVAWWVYALLLVAACWGAAMGAVIGREYLRFQIERAKQASMADQHRYENLYAHGADNGNERSTHDPS